MGYLDATINDFLDLDDNVTILDETPQILEFDTPDTSFNDSLSFHSEINLIEFSPIKIVVSHAINTITSVVSNRSDLDVFIRFVYFIYNLSLSIIFAIVLGPENEGYPDHSFCFEDSSILSDSMDTSSISSTSENESLNEENAHEILLNLRKKNVDRVIVGTLNINTVLGKLDQLQVIIDNSVDILTIQETKLDKSVTTEQLMIQGYN